MSDDEETRALEEELADLRVEYQKMGEAYLRQGREIKELQAYIDGIEKMARDAMWQGVEVSPGRLREYLRGRPVYG